MKTKVTLFLLACCLVSAYFLYNDSSAEKIANSDSLALNHSISVSTIEKEVIDTIPQSLDQSLESVNHLLEQYENFNGGVILEGNCIVVHTVGEQQKLSNELSKLSTDDTISVKPVLYSLKQLNQVQQRVTEEASIAASYIDIEHNRVVIILNELTEEIMQTIVALVPDEQMVAFVEGKVTLTDQAV